VHYNEQFSYPAQDALSEANIEPAEEAIQTSDVVAAVKAKFGVEPILHCSKGGGKEFLNEVGCCSCMHAYGDVAAEHHVFCVNMMSSAGYLLTLWPATTQVYMCVSKNLEVVDCATVCVHHDCVPSPSADKQDFCGDELIFKVPQDDLELLPANAADGEQCKLCKPKSGTCKPGGGGHGSTLTE
jgi:hypothetical protein